MTILVSKGGAPAEKISPSAVPLESFLQDYVHDHPEVLPMDEIREDIQLFVVAKEFATHSGPIDALALDQDGEIYVVETKLYKNPEKRQVIAQVLDYGAALWGGYASSEGFLADLREAVLGQRGVPLEDAVADRFGLDEEAVNDLLQSVQRNLEAGAFHFVILMDRMDGRLRDLITFVNQNSRFTVYGVELDFYQYEDLDIVIPRLYGAEVKKQVSGAGARRKTWDEASFFQDASERLTSDQLQAVRRFYEFSRETADRITWGTGAKVGSFNPKYDRISPRSIVTVFSDGRLAFNFGWLSDSPTGREFTEALAARIREDLALDLPQDYPGKYPVYPIQRWATKVDDLVRILRGLLDPAHAPQ